jgi:hypothetical protein
MMMDVRGILVRGLSRSWGRTTVPTLLLAFARWAYGYGCTIFPTVGTIEPRKGISQFLDPTGFPTRASRRQGIGVS